MKKIFLGMAVVALTAMSCNNNAKTNETETPEGDQVALSSDTEMNNTMTATDSTAMDETVADIAMNNDNFSTLTKAVQAAGLEETLQGDGPYTVFAPTNEAFDKLPEGSLEDLTKEENKAKLTSILTYHVVAGEFKAADVTKAINDNNGSYEINTVEGDKLTATLDGDNVILTDAAGNKAKVVMTDVDASNGVIHAIDTVLMPNK